MVLVQGHADLHGVLPLGLPSVVLLAQRKDLQRPVEKHLAHVQDAATIAHYIAYYAAVVESRVIAIANMFVQNGCGGGRGGVRTARSVRATVSRNGDIVIRSIGRLVERQHDEASFAD